MGCLEGHKIEQRVSITLSPTMVAKDGKKDSKGTRMKKLMKRFSPEEETVDWDVIM